MDEVVKYLRALLYLQIQSRLSEDSPVKLAVLLNRAGLSHEEIAQLLGKKKAAVAKAVSRARA